MKTKYFHLCIVLLLSACATLNTKPTVYGSYLTFIESLNKNSLTEVTTLLSDRHKNDLNNNSTYQDFESNFPVLSNLNNVLTQQFSHFEKTQNSTTCLSINGLDEGLEPTTINVKFLWEDNDWKLDYVRVFYLEDKNGFVTEGTCPIELLI